MWLNMIKESLGLEASDLSFGNLPAVGRVTVSSPAVMKPFSDFNTGKPYSNQMKPFNFLLTGQTNAFGHPTGADPKRFHLIAPYEVNPKKWLRCNWIDQYSGKPYRVTTEGDHGTRNTARVKTYQDVLSDYQFHPEPKCADAKGSVCGKQTIGLLQRRHVKIDRIVYIGKESNRLEEVESGMVHDEDSVYTEYVDPRWDQWQTKLLPALKKIPLSKLVEMIGLSRRALIDLRAGRSRPHPKNHRLLAGIAIEIARNGRDSAFAQVICADAAITSDFSLRRDCAA